MGKRICVIGGKLQGLEAIYLAKKAGYETWLVDKSPDPPASGLADEFFIIDAVKESGSLSRIMKKSDATIPALEDPVALTSIEQTAKKEGICFLHDNSAFTTTSNKRSFYKFCDRLEILYPPLPPEARYPLISKPVNGSGSRGVRMVSNEKELLPEERVGSANATLLQEYVSGAFLSLELLGLEGKASPLQITGLEFDETFGCKRVVAPINVAESMKNEIESMGAKIAVGLTLTGLMDVQVVMRAGNDRIELIESNARLPSQTPTAVFLSSGKNIVELLTNLFLEKRLPMIKCFPERAVIYQHLFFSEDVAYVGAEHHISRAKNLRTEVGFHGADESITNLPSGGSPKGSFVTLMVTGKDLVGAKKRLVEATESICHHYGVSLAKEKAPEGMVSFYDKIDFTPS